MVKKRIKLTRREKVSHFRWEFLRRNKNYVSDFVQKIPNYSETVFATEGLRKKEYEYFLKKYGIYFPINPAYSFHELKKISENEMTSMDNIKNGKAINFLGAFLQLEAIRMQSELWINPMQKAGLFNSVIDSHLLGNENIFALKLAEKVFLLTHKTGKKDKGPVILKKFQGDVSKITINLDLSLPKNEIMKHLEHEISKWKEIYNKNYKARIRIENYDNYLRVYIYVDKYGFDKAAKRFYKSDIDRGEKHYAIKKIKRDYARCQKLINGGYRQIR